MCVYNDLSSVSVTFWRVIKTSVQKVTYSSTHCVYIYKDLITDPIQTQQQTEPSIAKSGVPEMRLRKATKATCVASDEPIEAS